MIITVQWPSTSSNRANIWRILDLAGMTKTHRQSHNAVKSGLVYLNGNKVNGFRDTVEVGSRFTLELRYSDRAPISRNIFLVSPTPRQPRRGSGHVVFHRRG